MVPRFFATKAASLAVLFACAQPTLAGSDFVTPFDPDVLWPAPIEVESSFEGLGVDIKGLDMAMGLDDATAASGGDVQGTKWLFADSGRLSPEKIQRDDISTLRVKFGRAKGFEDYLRVISSRWHTGNQIIRMTRYVTMTDVTRQPLVDSFVGSVLEKYGPLDDEPYSERQIAGLGGFGYTGRLWTWDGGARNATCEVYGLPNDLKDVYRNSLERLEEIVADINTPEACDAVIKVYHDSSSAGTVKHYLIEITDIRLLFHDALNDRRVREHIQLYLENNLASGNTNAPDL